jgi:hypothetical protein
MPTTVLKIYLNIKFQTRTYLCWNTLGHKSWEIPVAYSTDNVENAINSNIIYLKIKYKILDAFN